MPVEIVKYGRENACSSALAASFGDPVLCPGLMDARRNMRRSEGATGAPVKHL
jgi:hypothetical protein